MIVEEPTVETIRDYEQMRTPDFALLSSLIVRAKGPERSMAQFAEETQIGASTLSRLVNLNVKKPLSIDSIIKIFECRADKENTGLLDALARANGLYPKEYAERAKRNDHFAAKRNYELSMTRMMKNTLIAGVAACGIPIKGVINNPRPNLQSNPPLYLERNGDFMLDLDSAANTSVIRNWVFYLFPTRLDETDGIPDARFMVRRTLSRISGCFLLDTWQPEEVRGTKVSFAFLDRNIYEQFVASLQNAKLHNEMSVILVDPEGYSVVEETWIPGDYECLSNISVFEVPAPLNENNYDENMEDNE